MKKLTLRQGSAFLLVALVVLGVLFYAIAREQLSQRINVETAVAVESNVGELLKGGKAEQQIYMDDDILYSFSVFFQTYSRANTSHLEISILDGDTPLYQKTVDTSTLEDNASVTFSPNLAKVQGKTLTLRISSPDGQGGDAVTVGYGASASVGKGSVPLTIDYPVTVNGTQLDGCLSMELVTVQRLWFGMYYWYFLAAVILLAAGYILWLQHCQKVGKSTWGLRFADAMHRYRFLLHQLVERDFKTKYKRSVLGVFWSFLNPLLTMLVQYVVFSTLFRSDVPNYPVYLLSGIVCFSYFSESISQCMMSIVGNAPLITKVYVPKYIYPLSKTLSSGINVLLSLLPLLLVMLLTGLWPKPAILLLPFGLICLFMLVLGLGMIMATSMVFFRDTQFLWGVVSMLWMYGTPIFYPESIIPDRVMMLYKMNPLYHVIRFFRAVLIDGVSPEPKAYLLCLIACLVPLLLGILAFKKNQDQFVLYI